MATRMSVDERGARVAVDYLSRSPAKSFNLSQAPMMARKSVVHWLVEGLGRSKTGAYRAVNFAVSNGWLQVVPGLPRYLALGPYPVHESAGIAPAKIYGKSGRVVMSLCLECKAKSPLSDLCGDCMLCEFCCLENRMHALFKAESARDIFGNVVDSVWVL